MGGELPVAVSAHGLKYVQLSVEDVVFAVLRWSNGTAAHIHVSWLDPRKTRTMTLVGSRKMVVYDDVSDDKLTIYDKGFDFAPPVSGKMDYDERPNLKLLRRWGDVWMPRIDFQEPLKVEVAHFLHCVRTGSDPLTGVPHARGTVAVLEAGERSLHNGGAEIAPAATVTAERSDPRTSAPLEAVA
jgi:predicted dehydrogenase